VCSETDDEAPTTETDWMDEEEETEAETDAATELVAVEAAVCETDNSVDAPSSEPSTTVCNGEAERTMVFV